MKAKYRVPEPLQSCHTALINGYVVEGHVPVDAIARLLKEKPKVIGLAVPGMPPGSPGMESANPRPYSVFAFDSGSRVTEYLRK